MADKAPLATQAPQPQLPLPVEGMGQAPEIYVDGLSGILVGNNVVKLNLFTDFSNPVDGAVVHQGALRLAMGIANLIALNEAITGFIQNAIEQGVIVKHENQVPAQTRQ